ncbi:MAG: GH92 family glycosyl hydrolase [Candidatus Eremiobacteraeota bacterium]|nr:GH92 family glycosyl hydrolase [Candidatus Eremiobacteraeota bacterium]
MKTLGAVCAILLLALVLSHAAAEADTAADPVALVDTLIGTSGNAIDGPSDTFPGADAPFGMIQWSPDTTSRPSGGGYSYKDEQISGFSLTHLSGPGCDVFGDIGILPTIGQVLDPANTMQPFTHVTETTSPGYYEIMLGQPAIRTQLTVTPRTGLGAFTFPPVLQANLLINASSNEVGVADARVRFVGNDRVEGSATSGWFCGMPGTYTVYFALQFNRPFVSHGTWLRKQLRTDSGEATGSGTGGWVTFDTTAQPTVKVKASVSWVSIAGAHGNLAAEATTWDLDGERRATAQLWRSELGRVRVEGGTPRQLRIFYSALYHAMLHPNVYSDADGSYRGFDGLVHHAAAGHAEYGTFSGWDIYRTQIPLIALVDPRRASDMMRSLVHVSQQMGWLPKWSLVNVESAVMGGDPSDPMIASAYAFGARDFDTKAALAAMVKGATQFGGTPGQGWYTERPALDEYASLGYVVNDHSTNVSPVANGASLTLEYSLADFSVAQFARALGDQGTYHSMMTYAQNWSNLFNQSSGLIAPRNREAAFTQAPITMHGQSGFQEGNAAQYTWMVPQNLAALINGLGGRQNAIAALDLFFTQLDAGPSQPYSWLGNEPTIGSPWTYLTAGAPWRTQRVVRDAMMQLWGDTPDGIPGNDDLGTMSAWYVWAALGLYPQNPSVPVLDLTAPLFQRASIHVPNGADIEILAPAASTDNAYVQSVQLSGKPWPRSWVRFATNQPMRLSFTVGSTPNTTWASGANDVPPSYALGFSHFQPSTSAALSASPSEIRVSPGGTGMVHVELSNLKSASAVSTTFKAQVPEGIQLGPVILQAAAGGSGATDAAIAVGSGTAFGLYDVSLMGTTAEGARLPTPTVVVRVARPGQHLPLAYVANYFDNTITPVDPRTHAFGVPIPVGPNPRDLTLSSDGRRIYVSDQGGQAVSVVDTETERVTATVAVAGSPWGIRVTPDGKTIWVSLTSNNLVQPIDAASLVAGKPIPVGDQPGGLAIAPNGALLLVADLRSNDVTPVDLLTRTARDPIAVGAHPRNIVVSPDSSTAYVTNSGANSVTVVDLATFKASHDIGVGVAPRGLAFSPDGKWLYVADFASNAVTPIETSTQSPQTPIVVGFNPVALLVDPSGSTALVVNAGDNDCVPLDLATRRVGQRIPLGNRPIAIGR